MSAKIIIGASPEIRVPLYQQEQKKRISVKSGQKSKPKHKPKK